MTKISLNLRHEQNIPDGTGYAGLVGRSGLEERRPCGGCVNGRNDLARVGPGGPKEILVFGSHFYQRWTLATTARHHLVLVARNLDEESRGARETHYRDPLSFCKLSFFFFSSTKENHCSADRSFPLLLGRE